MNKTVQKILFFVFSMALLYLIVMWGINAKKNQSPYVRFPDKIDTFK